MAQQIFMVDDYPCQTVTAIAEAAITAGNIVYVSDATAASPFGTTVAGNYDWSAIKVTSAHAGTTTQGHLICGIAIHDAEASSQVVVATEGLFLAPVFGSTVVTAGGRLKCAYSETTAGVVPVGVTTTAVAAALHDEQIIGQALTPCGDNSEGDYVLFKFGR